MTTITQGQGSSAVVEVAIIATLKAQRVTEWERAVSSQMRLRGCYDPSAESVMRAGIKVGNMVAQAEFHYERNYGVGGETHDERVIRVYNIQQFEDAIKNLGIAIDWSDVHAEYEALAKTWQSEHRAAMKVKRAESWDKSWAHAFITEATILRDSIVPGATFVITPTREKWMNDDRGFRNDTVNVEVTYCGVTTRVWMEGAEVRMYDLGYKTYRARKIETILKRIRYNTDSTAKKTQERNITAKRVSSNLTALQERFMGIPIDHAGRDHTYAARLLGRERFCHDVSFVYIEANPALGPSAEWYRIANIDGTLNEEEFTAILATLKAAAMRNDKAEREAAERRAVERAAAEALKV